MYSVALGGERSYRNAKAKKSLTEALRHGVFRGTEKLIESRRPLCLCEKSIEWSVGAMTIAFANDYIGLLACFEVGRLVVRLPNFADVIRDAWSIDIRPLHPPYKSTWDKK